MRSNRSSYYHQRRQTIQQQQSGSRYASAALDASAVVSIIRQNWPTFSISTVASNEQIAAFVEDASTESCKAVVVALLQLLAKPVSTALSIGENCESTVFVRSDSPQPDVSAAYSNRRATVVRFGTVAVVSPQQTSLTPPIPSHVHIVDSDTFSSGRLDASARADGNFTAFKSPMHQSETPHRMPVGDHRTSIQSAVFLPAIQTHKTNVVEDEDDDTIIQINEYCIVDEAGRGMYGCVKIAVKDNDPLVYAIKIIARKRMRTRTIPRVGSDGSLSSSKPDDDSRGKEPDHGLLAEAKDSDCYPLRLKQLPTAQHFESGDEFVVPVPTLPPATSEETAPAAAPKDANVSSPEPPGKLPFVPAPPADAPSAVSPRLQVAIAEMSDDFSVAPTPKQFQDEVEVMKKLHHRNVVRLIEVIDDPNDPNLYLVMPYMDRGPIMSLGKDNVGTPLDCDVAKGYMRQITAGLAYLHSQGLAHLDLKPDNILLDATMTCYLSDFGTSKFVRKPHESRNDAAKLSGFRGTPAFAAPEVISATTYDPFAADMWSLGVTLYAMIFGRLPFRGETLALLLECILQTEPDFTTKPQYNSSVSVRDDGDEEGPDLTEAIDLMKLLMDRNPSKRPRASAVRSHPFIAQRKQQKFRGFAVEIREEVEKAREKPEPAHV